jgi:cytochrome c biogenesis protein CcmG/thiol:disulfide interchange protein DsbE
MNAKKIVIIALILGFVGFILFYPEQERGEKPTGLSIGMSAPDFKLTDLNQKKWDLAELKGTVVVVNFWATWCPPCKEEMPSLNRFYGKYESRDDLEVLAILYNDTPGNADEFVKKGGINFPILIDPLNATAVAYGLTGVPETYILDKQGVLRKKFIGPVEFDSATLYTFIDMLLAEKDVQEEPAK